MEITATELKKDLGKFMDMATDGEEIVVTKRGEAYVKLVPAKKDPIEAMKGLVGIVSEDDFPPIGEDPKFDRILKRGPGYEDYD